MGLSNHNAGLGVDVVADPHVPQGSAYVVNTGHTHFISTTTSTTGGLTVNPNTVATTTAIKGTVKVAMPEWPPKELSDLEWLDADLLEVMEAGR